MKRESEKHRLVAQRRQEDHSPAGSPESSTSLSWRSRLWFLTSVLIGLGWLAPVLFLLYWNFKGHVIGAEVGCPNGYCPLNSYYLPFTYASRSDQYDKHNSDALGALQLVAKALEVYFIYNACSLVWSVMKLMLKSKAGLPTGHLLRHIELADFVTYFDPAFWGPMIRPRHTSPSKRSNTKGISLFAIFAFLIAVIANLMGPAIAILVLPQVRWQDAPLTPQQRFQHFYNADQPNNIPGCSLADLAAQNYNCTAETYGSALDALAEYYHSTLAQDRPNQCYETQGGIGVAREKQLVYSYNITSHVFNLSNVVDEATNTIAWAPNRQLIRELADDAFNFTEMTCGTTPRPQYAPFNSSIHVLLERAGPIIGYRFKHNWVQIRKTQISSNQEIRCHQPLRNGIGIPSFLTSLCFRVGSGWGDISYPNASIHISDGQNASTTPIDVDLYTIQDPIRPNQNNDFENCLRNGTLPSGTTAADCTWDAITSRNRATTLDSLSRTGLVFELSVPNSPRPDLRLITTLVPMSAAASVPNNVTQKMVTHSVDMLAASPNFLQVSIADLPVDQSNALPAIPLDPRWLLAALSVPNNGTMNMTRPFARILSSQVPRALDVLVASDGDDRPLVDNAAARGWSDEAATLAMFAALQAGSLVGYNSTALSDADVAAYYDGGSADPTVLGRNVHYEAYAYAFDTGLSIFATVVAIAGIVVVLARAALKVATGAEDVGAMELVVAALAHVPDEDERAALVGREEKEVAGLRYRGVRVREDAEDVKGGASSGSGRLDFEMVRG